MARTCTVCTHPEREAIDRALVGGCVQRDITRRYGLDRTAVSRHKSAHISPALVRAAAKREERHESSLLDRIENLIDRLEVVVEREEAKGNSKVSILALRELRSTLALLGQASGELQERPTTVINVLQAPDWLAVREAMFEVLAHHPAVQAEVAARLDRLALEPPSGIAQEAG